MTIFVDEPRYHADGLWCHMATDGPIEELHKFAHKIGLRRSWFQNHPLHPHYDLRPSKREAAIREGAQPVTTQELVKRCSAYFDDSREHP